jgi:hypothetical protein
MNRWDIINELIKKYDYKTYLEIGVQNKLNFNKIVCNIKISVDPDEKALADYVLTSDDYFDKYKQKFDCIFIDGLHHNEQMYKDIVNSLSILSENGTIVIHDCNPKEEIHQIVPRVSKVWNGDVWKAWVKFRLENSKKEGKDVDYYYTNFVVDTDYGCSVIRKEKSCFSRDIALGTINQEMNWGTLKEGRQILLNLITVKEFEEWLKN